MADQRMYADKRSRRTAVAQRPAACAAADRPRARPCPAGTHAGGRWLGGRCRPAAGRRRAPSSRPGSGESCTTSARPRSRTPSSASPAIDRRRMGVHAHPHRRRRAHPPRRSGARGDRADRAQPPRALERRRLPRSPAGREIPPSRGSSRSATPTRRWSPTVRTAPGGRGEALDELERCAGSHFDPAVVEAFVAMMLEVGNVPPVQQIGGVV